MRDIQEKRAATSMQQRAEWGMHGLQASFHIFIVERPYDLHIHTNCNFCHERIKVIKSPLIANELNQRNNIEGKEAVGAMAAKIDATGGCTVAVIDPPQA